MRFIKKETHIDFLGKRKIAGIVSCVLILIGLVVFGVKGKNNFGIDFTGGLVQQIEFENTVSINNLRKALVGVGLQKSSIQQVSENDNMFIIKTAYNAKTQLVTALNQNFKDNSFKVLREEMVGPVVGKDLSKQGILAIIFSLLGILLYISWRFEFRFAIGAVSALFHDVLITIGILSICNKEITLQILAALLTIVGYSLNDTIVVFDRIREVLKISKKHDIEKVVNNSVNQTLSRTLLTSLTTFFVVFFLFMFGGEVIHDFAFALMVGIIVGTYSSIFIASPVVVIWDKLGKKTSS
jgi:preprotein translocase subunit SecF